jgi:hypothetical protein
MKREAASAETTPQLQSTEPQKTIKQVQSLITTSRRKQSSEPIYNPSTLDNDGRRHITLAVTRLIPDPKRHLCVSELATVEANTHWVKARGVQHESNNKPQKDNRVYRYTIPPLSTMMDDVT